MTPFDKLLLFLVNTWQIDLVIVAKIAVVIFLLLYIVFSLVVVRQVNLMSRTINGLMEKNLLWGARALVVLAVAALVMGLIVL